MVTVGVDIVEVDRIARAIERWGIRFLDKALKVGKASIWREVEVARGESPRPALLLHGGARELTGARRIDLSLSHASTHAVAVVLVEE